MIALRNRYLIKIAPLFIAGTCCLCQKPDEFRHFKNLSAAESGIFFVNELSYSEDFNMIDYLYYYDGGGVAVGDINNDGLSDIYLVSNEGENALYLNQGAMKFLDISENAGVKSPGLWKTGVSMVDVNGDGFLDIYLCRLGNYKGVKGKNELYINQGDLTFKEQATKYNLDFTGFSTQAAFFDMDNDGDLDVYLLNHSVHSQTSFGDTSLRMNVDSLAGDKIYENDNNYFTDVSPASGIYRSQLGYGLGIGLSDINQDGFTDIFVANDFIESDLLYLNNQDGTFTEVFQHMADYASLSSMGCDLADFNNDGLVDIVTLDMLPESEVIRKKIVGEDPLEIFSMKLQMGYIPQYKRNMLQLNRGDGSYSDIAMMAGIHATDWSWAPLFADFDNDGWKDLFISNGIKGRPNDLDYLTFINSNQVTANPNLPDSVLFNSMPGGSVSNYFYRNNKDLTFENVSDSWGVVPDLITSGVAYSDLDNDGDLDLVLNNLDRPAIIKENTINDEGTTHFLGLELSGVGGNTKAIGAKIELFYGDNYQFLEQYPVRGFKSSVDNRLFIGLGQTGIIDSLVIMWPGGGETKLFDQQVDRIVKLSQADDNGTITTNFEPTPMFEPVSNKSLGVKFAHRENIFVEFSREPLVPHMHSQEGPALAVADVNSDGLDDFFVGGAKHQEGAIFLQTTSGFKSTDQPAMTINQVAEEVDAAFLDFDQDGDQDLLVVNGGNEFQGDSPNRQPSLYLNDGNGLFTHMTDAFSGIYLTGSCVAINDFDGDGWQDVFLGSQVVPWNYGMAPNSYLLKNDSGKRFIDVSEYLPDNGLLGMVNDAEWVALEGVKSLVIAGEWMNISILTMEGKTFKISTIPESSGWWQSIHAVDYDGDGDLDLLAGNLGLNSKLKATNEHPLNLYLEDFDKNGKLDAIMTVYIGDKETIFNSNALLKQQIPSIGLILPADVSLAEASPKDLFGNGLLEATKLSVKELRSGIYINDGNGFHFEPFPSIMQISPIRDFLAGGITQDTALEIFSVGNLFTSSTQEGRYAAGRGSLMTGLPQSPEVLPNWVTGMSVKGDARRIGLLNFQGNDLIAVAVNNDSIVWFKRNNQ